MTLFPHRVTVGEHILGGPLFSPPQAPTFTLNPVFRLSNLYSQEQVLKPRFHKGSGKPYFSAASSRQPPGIFQKVGKCSILGCEGQPGPSAGLGSRTQQPIFSSWSQHLRLDSSLCHTVGEGYLTSPSASDPPRNPDAEDSPLLSGEGYVRGHSQGWQIPGG